MPALRVREAIVLVLPQQCHGQSGLVLGLLFRAAALDGPDRHDVVKRHYLVTATSEQLDAEILGVTIRRRHQPEQHLTGQQTSQVLPRPLGAA